jgi:hypothetical protein
MYAPVTLVAAGTIDISGSIVRAGGVPDGGCALALIAGGIRKQGRIPEGTIGVAPSARVEVVGPELIVTDHLALSRGLPVGAKLLAEAVTDDWYRLKQAGERQIVVEIHEPRGVTVFMEVAAPDPVDPDRPFRDPETPSAWQRVPTSAPLTLSVPANCYVRFKLSAEVAAGQPLPDLKAIVVRQQ